MRSIERFVTILGGDPVLDSTKVRISQGAGFYFGLGALLLLAGFSLAPTGGRSVAPLAVLGVLGLASGGYGATKLGSDSELMFKEAFSEMKNVSGDLGEKVKAEAEKVKAKAEEGIDTLKEKLDKGDAPPAGGTTPAPPGADPFQ